MSSSTRFLGTVHGGSFDGGVAWPGESAPVEPPRAPGIRDDLGSALFDLRVVTDPKQQKQLAALIAARIELNRKTEEFLRAQAAREKEHLARQHEELKTEIRQLLQKIEATKNEALVMRSEHARCQSLTEHALGELHSARQARAALSKYAPAGEIKRADTAIARAEARVNEAQQREAGPMQHATHLSLTVVHSLSEKLRTLQSQEKDLALAVNGQGGGNSLGFIERPRI